MKITEITPKGGASYTIYVDGEYWYILNAEIVNKYGLNVGMEVDGDFLNEVVYQASRRKARERAFHLLDYRAYSKKELYDKLIKTNDPRICAEVIEMLENERLLDDEAYAERLAEFYLQTKKWGRKKAFFEMTKRGLDGDTAQAALDNAEYEYSATENIREIINKKYYDKLGDYKSRQKVIAAFLRLGYGISDIKNAMAEFAENEEISESEEFSDEDYSD